MKKSYNLRFLIISLLLPLAILMYYFSRNATEVSWVYTAALGGALLLLFALAWGAARLLFRSPFSAFGVCAVLCLFLYTWTPLRGLLPFLSSGWRNIAILALAAVVCVVVGLLLRRVPGNGEKLSLFLLLFVGIFAAMNIYSSVRAAVAQTQAANTFDSENLKTSFMVDADAPSPNIYWFHCDGMLDFESFERFFGGNQQEFRDALAQRGFAIYEDASFETAHSTAISIVAQMSPGYYDNSLSGHLVSHEEAMAYRQSGPDLSQARLYNELVNAFTQKGYETFVISKGGYYATNSDTYYDYFSQPVKLTGVNYLRGGSNVFSSVVEMERLREFGYGLIYPVGIVLDRLVGTLAEYTEAVLPDNSEALSTALDQATRDRFFMTADTGSMEVNFTACMLDMLEQPSTAPRLAILHTLLPHAPFRYDENGNYVGEGGEGQVLENYYGHHTYASRVLIQYVDAILEKDPGAIIVLQSDHGLHLNTAASFEAFTGQPGNEQALWNGVLSAVRIPEGYAAPEDSAMEETPLNIARVLINRFVGRNYSYLS